ncbi:MAG: class I SAM-dependent methyltransferase [Candidatus Yonathbacteria bacterium]|nr:class I SAM-dependent methyltransferase [Candidatus Yonathbacteria bacterium]NTW48042.1 class I SAM-dependent methyltransferase [Candidatus Yonathbacteria bacterium]
MTLAFANPESTIARLYLHEGMSVADIGAGTGAYTFIAAEKVGPSGHVYAIDVRRELLGRIASVARQTHLSNIGILAGDVERIGGTRLPDISVDVVMLSNILFLIEQKKDTVAEVRRILKKGGRVMIIDWIESFGGIGPQSDMVVTKTEAIQLFTDGGFVMKEVFDAGAYHYGIICEKI